MALGGAGRHLPPFGFGSGGSLDFGDWGWNWSFGGGGSWGFQEWGWVVLGRGRSGLQGIDRSAAGVELDSDGWHLRREWELGFE